MPDGQGEVTEDNFDDVVRAADLDPDELEWSYSTVTSEFFTFIKKYLTGKGKKAFCASNHEGFEGYRRLVAEIDPINSATKAGMMESLTGMIGHEQCKSLKETKSELLDMELVVKQYRERLHEKPDIALLASVLSNILDFKTKDKFTDLRILHDYESMKQKILESATEANVGATMRSNKMDVGSVSQTNPVPTYQMNASDSSQASVKSDAPSPKSQNSSAEESINYAEGEKKPPNPNIICFTCGQKGHPSFMCPKGAAKGKGGQKGYQQNSYFPSKGAP